jgi:hypothetical protein
MVDIYLRRIQLYTDAYSILEETMRADLWRLLPAATRQQIRDCWFHTAEGKATVAAHGVRWGNVTSQTNLKVLDS